MIAEIIKELQNNNHYNVGEFIELAKGKNEMVTSWKDFKAKITRLWRLRKTLK